MKEYSLYDLVWTALMTGVISFTLGAVYQHLRWIKEIKKSR